MRMVYLPGTEETTITQAVPPVRGHSITLRGLVPAVIPNADGIPTWHRGDHNHAGSSSSARPLHHTSGGLVPAVIPNADGIPTWHRGDHNHAGSSSSARPLHHTSGVGPCGHP